MSLPMDYEAPAQLLQGRCVLVTGAGDGLGKAIALACAAHGAEVVLLDRVVRKLEALYDQILAIGGAEPAIYPLDLEGAVPDDYEDLAGRVLDATGGLHALVHNAARLGALSPLEGYDPVEWAKVMQVNLNAPFLLTRALLPVLRRNQDARLLFLSDQAARAGRAYWGAYCVSKFAIEGLMQVLAEELENEDRVKVCSVDPGPLRTGLRAAAFPAEDRGHLRQPEEVARALLYVLGPDGRALHGQHLGVPPKAG